MTLFDGTVFAHVLITLLVIMDPPGTIPVFLALTGRKPRAVRTRAAGQAVAVSFGVIAVFAVAGNGILAYLGIGIAALQGAGGVLLLLVALDLLRGGQGSSSPEAVDDVNVALVPLGTPLLAGPGAIAATIVFVRQADRLGSYVAVGIAIIAVHLVLYLVLRFSGVVIRLIREGGIVLVAKVAGLLLAAIAVQLVATSVRGFVAGG